MNFISSVPPSPVGPLMSVCTSHSTSKSPSSRICKLRDALRAFV